MEEIEEKEIEVREIIEEGKYEAEIVDIRYRDEPYEYIDVIFEIGGNVQVKAGYPARLSKKTQLGKLLEAFGMDLSKVKKVKIGDIKKLLKGKKATLLVSYDDNGFLRVVKDSVKPVA